MTYWYMVSKTVLRIAVVSSVALLIGVAAAKASSSTYTVSKCTESGLDKALRLAHDDDTINFKCDGTIILSTTKKIIHSITIDASDRNIILDGHQNGIFQVAAGVTVSITRLTFTHVGDDLNRSSTESAIQNFGTVWVGHSTFLENSGPYGAAIDNFGTLMVQDSYFEGNHAVGGPDPHQFGTGGAISNSGNLIVNNSTFINNSSANGGAIINAGALTIDQSIFTQNVAESSDDCNWCGGAITNLDPYGLLVMRNSVVYANKEFGIINLGIATIINSTIVQNMAAKPVPTYANVVNWNEITLRGTIIASGLPNLSYNKNVTTSSKYPTNCLDEVGDHQGIIDGGGNLQYPDNSCGLNIPIADPKLTPFGDYGFATPEGAEGRAVWIIGLQPGSPAIDNGFCRQNTIEEIDGRGFPRVRGSRCDTGAFEFEAIAPTPVATVVPLPNPTATAS